MTVNIIRKSTDVKMDEVTDKMLEAIYNQSERMLRFAPSHHLRIPYLRQAMEYARVAEQEGEIERIDVIQDGKIEYIIRRGDINVENIRPLAEALLLLDKQINGGGDE